MIETLLLIWLIFGTLIGQMIILLIGYTFLFFLPNHKEFPALQKLAICYGIGTGLISLSMFFFILMGIHTRLSYLPILIITLILFFYFRMWKNLKQDIYKILSFFKNRNWHFNRIEIFCIIILVFEVFTIFLSLVSYPIYSWDAIALWDAKAKFFFFDGNFDYLFYLKDHPRLHPSYPLLVPLNMSFFYSIFFQYHQFVKILFFSYFLFLIIFFYYSLRHFNLNKTYSILITTFFSILGEVFFHSTIAYADIALTFFYTLGTIFLFYYISTNQKHYLIYASIFLGFMAWVKEEGIALFSLNVIILIIYQLFLLLKKRTDYKTFLKRSSGFFLIGFLIYLPWLIIWVLNGFSSDFTSTNIFQIFDIKILGSKLIIIFKALVLQIFEYSNWSFIFWLVLIIILLFNIRIIFKEKIFFLFFLCFVHFVLYIFIYIITPLPLRWHLGVSLSRMLLHLAPIFCFLIGMILIERKEKIVNFTDDKIHKIFIYFFSTLIIIFLIGIVFFYDFVSNAILNIVFFVRQTILNIFNFLKL